MYNTIFNINNYDGIFGDDNNSNDEPTFSFIDDDEK